MNWVCALLIALMVSQGLDLQAPVVRAAEAADTKLYTNARFGFSVRYPGDWRLGDPMADGIGISLYPPVEKSQIALSGFMNLVGGTSQDGRQTLDEFAASHRRIITELYDKKQIQVTWQKDQETTLAGFPAKRLAFTYQDDRRNAMLEVHIFSLGRNEGRGVRIKLPADQTTTLMPTITRMLESYEAGRDQNAVSPIVPKEKG
jgi:hypothetical protein